MLIVQRNFRTTHITRTGLEWETNDYVGKTTVKSSSLGSVSNFLNTLRCRRHKTRGSVGRNSSPRKPANALHSLWKDNRHNNNKQHSERLLPAPRERYAFISKHCTAVPLSTKYLHATMLVTKYLLLVHYATTWQAALILL